MLATLRARLTFANVCSFLALLIALGTGSAYAANTVFSDDIVNGEVKTADIDNNVGRHSTKIGTGRCSTRTWAPTQSTAQRCSTTRSPSRPRQRLGQLGQRRRRALTSS